LILKQVQDAVPLVLVMLNLFQHLHRAQYEILKQVQDDVKQVQDDVKQVQDDVKQVQDDVKQVQDDMKQVMTRRDYSFRLHANK
jgi:septal ring factor EnvC (AmiA/AmiB activator)